MLRYISTRSQHSVRTPSPTYKLYIHAHNIIKYVHECIILYSVFAVYTHMAHSQNYSIRFTRQKQTVRPKTLLAETPRRLCCSIGLVVGSTLYMRIPIYTLIITFHMYIGMEYIHMVCVYEYFMMSIYYTAYVVIVSVARFRNGSSRPISILTILMLACKWTWDVLLYYTHTINRLSADRTAYVFSHPPRFESFAGVAL